MAFWRERVCWLLLALAIACFVVGAFPQWNEWVDPANGDNVSEYRLGFWFSPVYQHVRRDHRQVVGGALEAGYTIESGRNWLSWSSLVILIGLGSFGILRWRRNAVAGPQSQARGIQAKGLSKRPADYTYRRLRNRGTAAKITPMASSTTMSTRSRVGSNKSKRSAAKVSRWAATMQRAMQRTRFMISSGPRGNALKNPTGACR